ncbi:hypothetical protein QFC20_006390 [Naganishia adeliensis]|uniref:Uncharacterized protein n=1 Tax=Naganishia adeliensis TaxID=92952 RepID=A0ACC2VBY1_9TREE|nr:hypothetical protein QFC20_006390 [Naganishia adeliensis]
MPNSSQQTQTGNGFSDMGSQTCSQAGSTAVASRTLVSDEDATQPDESANLPSPTEQDLREIIEALFSPTTPQHNAPPVRTIESSAFGIPDAQHATDAARRDRDVTEADKSRVDLTMSTDAIQAVDTTPVKILYELKCNLCHLFEDRFPV